MSTKFKSGFVVLIGCFCFLLPLTGHSQGNFKIFFEKVYLHTDRNYYAAGDDIWFKAYLINAQTGTRINTSNNLYVELISPTAEVITRETVLLQNGLGQGDFSLPANAASGNYRIRAYTNWMQNFSDFFMFEKVIQVAADPEVKATKPARYTPDFVNEPYRSTDAGSNTIQFFPEGGSLVAGIANQVAFKAVNKLGLSLALQGKIINAAGDSVAALTTSHAGLGSFVFTPQPGILYKAVGKYATKELFDVALPPSAASGFTIHLQENTSNFAVQLQADAGTAQKMAGSPLTLTVRHTGKKVFTDSTIALSDAKKLVNIPKQLLPPGISIVTLYDAQKRPWCERLFFVDDTTEAKILMSATAAIAGQQTTVDIGVTDKQNKPLAARLSLAAADAGIIPAGTSSIASYFLLESELKGTIENPLAYFDVNNSKRLQQLDLLLLTQGFRQFIWRRLQDTSVVIRYMPEPGITLSGRVQKTFGKKGVEGMDITLYAEQSKGDKLFLTKTNAQGNYFLDGLPLYGRQDVRLSVRDPVTLKREGRIFLDSLYGKPWPLHKISDLVLDTSAITNNFWRQAANRKKIMVTQDIKDKGELENVTVIAKPKPIVRLAETIGTRFGADSLFTIKVADGEFQTLERYILYKYPGAVSNADTDGFFFYGDKGAKIRPQWVINGQEDRFGNGNSMDVDEETGRNDGAYDRVDYFNIPISKVKTVAVTPIVDGRNKQHYVISLNLLPGALDLPDFSILNATINGYYEARQYFEPSFKSTSGNVTKTDLRSTIFWVPMLQTDAGGKTAVRYTNSPAKNIRVTVEGLTDSGIPVAASMVYPVK